jgi:beta-RFAP synthase
MFSFGHSTGPQWGGVGVMIEPPSVTVKIKPAASLVVSGSHVARSEQFVRSVTRDWQLPTPPACRVEVTAPSEHIGLGVGTQLGLSIAAGLRQYLVLPALAANALATSVGRGRRSAVGTHGFLLGGLIVDAGKEPVEPLGTLSERLSLPEQWRFVLITSSATKGLAGKAESNAFSRLPPVPGEVTQELWRLTEQEILPAVKRADCAAFGEAVYHFGRFAGECFAPVQGGPFTSEATGQLVDAIREYGIAGVGQSSWGPTVFAAAESEGEANALVDWLRDTSGVAASEITVARPNNHGAIIEQSN